MKTILLGNAGAGKSTLSRQLLESEPAATLSLDALAFAADADRRPLADSIGDALHFVKSHDRWIVEGCYADIVEPLLGHADTLVSLNPGVEACVRHCQARPWEPDKYATRAAQDAKLASLIAWVRDYDTRSDEYDLQRHRALFEAFAGRKVEVTDPAQYRDAAAALLGRAASPGVLKGLGS